MPGYVIHLAVGEEYIRKHKKKEEYNEFIKGIIFPDSVRDKSETHYGESSSKTNLYDFLKDVKVDTSFNRGYFLHLLTDYLFYNRYIDTFSKDMYNDYDILNKKLMGKYNVTLPKEVEKRSIFKEGELKLLSYELVENMIKDISDMNIDEVVKDIKKYPDKWTKMRELKRL